MDPFITHRFSMINATIPPSALSPPAAQRDPRSRPRALAIAATVVGSVLAPGMAAVSGGAPALPARTVQEQLVALGRLPADAITGRYDQRTLDAVARFQAALGLAVDGVPDARTADELLRATAT
jgi:peptidoglycan hydrolase-like protein with peptidoglycan-binding domain